MEIRRARPISAELEMAPLIDVVFLLLIFFLLTSSFMQPEAIDLKLPNAESSTETQIDDVLRIALGQDGTILVDDVAIAQEELTGHLKPRFESKPDQPVLLKSDAGAQVEEMISVLDKVRLAGGKNVNIATQKQ